MKQLIVYMSHHGTTQKVAEELREKLGPSETVLIDLEKEEVPPLDSFQSVFIGGSIYMGTIQKKIKQFCEANQEILLSKKLGLFLCFMNKKDAQKEFDESFPEKLRHHATACGLFGGEIDFEKMNFIEKFIVRKVSGIKENSSSLDEDAIENFADTVR